MIRQDQDALFAKWMSEHSSIALRTARTFEFNPGAQADLLQEILLAWWRSIPTFSPSADARRWLYRVSLNTAFTWQRQECRRARVIDQSAPFAYLIGGIAQPADPVDRDALDELYRAIQQLPPTERALVVLHLEGFSYDEMADTFGISPNAVGSRLTRARDNLGQILKEMRHRHERV